MYYAFREPNPRSEYYTKLAFLTIVFLSFPHMYFDHQKGMLASYFLQFSIDMKSKDIKLYSRLDWLKEDRGKKRRKARNEKK